MKQILLLSLSAIFLLPTITWGQSGNVFTYKFGSGELTLLSEGQGNGSPGILIGATEDILAKYLTDGRFPNATNAFLLRLQGKNVLIDAGHGRELFNNLESVGVSPEQIDVILISHMHGDHINGLLINGVVAFPNAELYIAKPEHDFFVAQESAKRVIDAYQEKLRLFQPVTLGESMAALDISLPYIKGIAAFGHTPGHTCFLIESDGESILVWGDLTHAMAIQMPCPQIAVTYDSDPVQAVKSRVEILQFVTAHNIPVAGMHIAFPAIGKITVQGEGYMFTPL